MRYFRKITTEATLTGDVRTWVQIHPRISTTLAAGVTKWAAEHGISNTRAYQAIIETGLLVERSRDTAVARLEEAALATVPPTIPDEARIQ